MVPVMAINNTIIDTATSTIANPAALFLEVLIGIYLSLKWIGRVHGAPFPQLKTIRLNYGPATAAVSTQTPAWLRDTEARLVGASSFDGVAVMTNASGSIATDVIS